MGDRNLRVTLKAKLMFSILSLSIISIAIIACTAFFSLNHYIRQSTAHSLEGLAKLKSQAIDNFMKDRVDQIEKTASSSDLVGNLEKMSGEKEVQQQVVPDVILVDNETPPEGIFEEVELQESEKEVKEEVEKSAEYQALNKALSIVLGDGMKYEELFILDTSGAVVVSTVYENEGKSAQNIAFFTNGVKTTFIQEPFISDITKKLAMVIATPIKDENGKVIGVLGARLNLDKFYQVIRDETGLGSAGETIVGKKMGEEIVFMGPTRHDSDAALKRKVSVKAERERLHPLQEATRGREGYGFYKDYRGVETIAAWCHISSLDWGLIVKMDVKEALEPVLNTGKVIVVLAMVLIIAVIFLASFISKGIVSPIQELTRAADSISKGDTDVKITIRSKDEVGDLADSFERMLAAIKFLKEKAQEK
ncbi:MAG: HAMP domain-containing protein [Candidatus Omnitrophica bacterium]|nr:HAMP domain-containing protein [Candidatus Omnitrophota bacterium]